MLLVVAVALAFLNDVGRWVNAQSRLNEGTAQLAEWAAINVHTGSRADGAAIVTSEGAKRGMRVYQYDSDQTGLEIWSSVHVTGTWVIGPYMAIVQGTPVDKAVGAPFVVRSYQQAHFQ
jgi:hypothetical protein